MKIHTQLLQCKSWTLFFLASILGAIFPLGLAPLGWWPCLIVSVLGFMMLLDRVCTKKTLWIGFFYGIGFYGVGVSWVHVSIHLFGHATLALSVFLTSLFVVFLSCFKSLLAWTLAKVYQKKGRQWFLLAFPIIWVGFEGIISIFFTGFPWLYISYGWIDTWLAGWAVLSGAYGLSLVVMMILVMIYLVLFEVGKREKIITTICIGFLVVCGGVLKNSAYDGIKHSRILDLVLVQPNIDQNEKWSLQKRVDILNRYDNLIKKNWQSDLIILPESAIPASRNRVKPWFDRWQQQSKNTKTHLLTGIVTFEKKDEYYSSLISLGESQQRYDKYHLVPFGEFVPLEAWLRGLIDFFDLPMSSFSQGNQYQQSLVLNELVIIPAICYEIAYQSHVLSIAKDGYHRGFPILVTISNDAWFGRSWGPHQHLEIARMRALETGLPLLRSTNTGITAVMNYQGQIISQIKAFEENTLNYKGELTAKPTLFLTWGPFVTISLVIILGYGLLWFCCRQFHLNQKTETKKQKQKKSE